MRKTVPFPLRAILSSALIFGGVATAAAQSAQPAPPIDSVPEKSAPGPVSTDQPKNLSEKLDQTNGVIKPKEVDPAIEKPAPQTHTGDVIAPPAASGNPGAPQAK